LVDLYRFDKTEHFEDLIAMHVGQGSDMASIITKATLPKLGYIAYNDEMEPIAAAFLRQVEGGYGQLDTMVSNSQLSGMIRHNALSMIVDSLISDARALNLQGLICYTRDESVIRRAQSIGFHLCPHAVISLDLKGRV
jgi:hypothetical protein